MQVSTKIAIALGLVALSTSAHNKDPSDPDPGILNSAAAPTSLPYRLPLQSDTQLALNIGEFVRSMDGVVGVLWDNIGNVQSVDAEYQARTKPTLSEQEIRNALNTYQSVYKALAFDHDFEHALLRCEAVRTNFRQVLDTAVKERRINEDVAGRFACAEAIHWSTLVSHSLDFSGTAPQPEYSDNLNQLRIHCPRERTQPSALWRTQANIVCSVPDYTHINVFVAEAARVECQNTFAQTLEPSRYSQVSFQPVHHPLFDPWAQDASEGDARLQRTALTTYLPSTWSIIIDDMTVEYQNRSFVSSATQLQNGAVELPVFFEGGNVFIAEASDHRRVLLVGSSDYVRTKMKYERAGLPMCEQQFCAELARGFDIPDVRIIGPCNQDGFQEQPSEMFHLDQAILPLQPGVIGFLTPDFTFKNLDETVEKAKFEAQLMEFEQRWNEKLGFTLERRGEFPNGISYTNYPPHIVSRKDLSDGLPGIFVKERSEIVAIGQRVVWERDKHRLSDVLDGMRDQLQDFSFVPLQCSAQAAFNYRFPTNSIVYTNYATGEPTIIMPIYPNLEQGKELASVEAVLSSPSNYEAANIDVLKNLGFAVVPVVDYTDGRDRGSLHCLVGRY